MNNKILTLIAFLIILFSCQHDIINEYYDSGQIEKSYRLKDSKLHGEYKEFYLNGNIRLVQNYKNGMLTDSSVFYNEDAKISKVTYHLAIDTTYTKIFKNGKLRSEGKFFQNKKIEKWKYFDINENLEKVFEYIDLCGKPYTNQGWYFNKNGDTLKTNSNFIEYYNFKDKIKPKEILNFQILYTSLLKGDSKAFICLSPKINENFCNINEVKLDTIYPQNNSFEILLRFSKKGSKNIRGFITEFRIEEYVDKESARFEERKVYFDIPVIVE